MNRQPRHVLTASWAFALVCAFVPAQSQPSVSITASAELQNFLDGRTITVDSPTGSWVMPVARATLDVQAVIALFGEQTDALVTFLHHPDILPLIGPGVKIPAGTIANSGWVDEYTTPGACDATTGAWTGAAIRDALYLMLSPSVLNYQGVWPVVDPASGDLAVCSPVDPLAVASFLAVAFVPALPPPGNPAELPSENVRRFLQLSVPNGAANSTAGTTVWTSFGYPSWDLPYTPQNYRDYWSSILANHTDATNPGPGPMSNPTVISVEKWTATTLKASMGRDDAVAYLLTSLRTALAIAHPNGAPPVNDLPVCIDVLPIAVEDPSAVLAAAGNPVNFPTNPITAPGIAAAVQGNPPPPVAPRLRFGNPISFCLSLRELKSLTGTRNGESFDGSAAGGILKLPVAGAALGPVTATILAAGATHQVEMLPDVRPGMYVGDLPASVTPGTVVRVNAIATGTTTLSNRNGPLYLLVAQP